MESKLPEDLLEERDRRLSLAALADQEGGKRIIKALQDDIARYVERLATEYRHLPPYEITAVCADLNATLSLYRALSRSGAHVKEIEEMVKEALHED